MVNKIKQDTQYILKELPRAKGSTDEIAQKIKKIASQIQNDEALEAIQQIGISLKIHPTCYNEIRQKLTPKIQKLFDALVPSLKKVEKAEYYDLESLNNYTEVMPPNIEQEFEAGILTNYLKQFLKFPNTYVEVSLQVKHQMMYLKRTYHSLLLDAMGVPVHTPLAISPQGKWIVTAIEEPMPLADLDINSCDLKVVAAGIRKFFELERCFGITIIHNFKRKEDRIGYINLRYGSEVILRYPPNSIEFISGGVEERHRILEDQIKKNLPDALHTLIFSEPFNEPLTSENTAKFLSTMVSNKFISFQELLDFSPTAIQVQRMVSASENHAPEDAKEEIGKTLYQILTGLPSNAKPAPSQKVFRNEIPALVEAELALRKMFKGQVMATLLNRFMDNPNTPLKACLDALIEEINPSIIRKAYDDDNLCIPEMKKDVELAQKYLSGFWNPIYEFLSSAPDFKEKLILLRGAHIWSDKDQIKQIKVSFALYGVLHQRHLSYKKAAKIQRLRSIIGSVVL